MNIPPIGRDHLFLMSVAKMSLARHLTTIERTFIHSLLCSIKEKKPLTKIHLPASNTDSFTLDPTLIAEIIAQVKQETTSSEEEILLEFVEAIDTQEIKEIHNPLLKNYLLILSASFHPLEQAINEEQERIALAYSALHGTRLTQKVLKEHLTHFGISNPSVLADLKQKSEALTF